MEIELDKIESNNYYGEVLAVMSNYSKLVKNPKKKYAQQIPKQSC